MSKKKTVFMIFIMGLAIVYLTIENYNYKKSIELYNPVQITGTTGFSEEIKGIIALQETILEVKDDDELHHYLELHRYASESLGNQSNVIRGIVRAGVSESTFDEYFEIEYSIFISLIDFKDTANLEERKTIHEQLMMKYEAYLLLIEDIHFNYKTSNTLTSPYIKLDFH